MKKLLVILLVACTLFGCGTKPASPITGSYQSEADDNGDYNMCEVTLTDGVITAVSFDSYYAAKEATKKTLGADYNMIVASDIQKEWFEQVATLEEWCKGKTVADVLAKANDDADLKSGCTFGIDGLLAALEEAAKAAK